MKKTLTTKSGRQVTFELKDKVITASEGEATTKVGWLDDDFVDHFEIVDYYDEFDIRVSGESKEQAFDAFCEAFISHLNVREVKREDLINTLTRKLDAYKNASIVDRDTFTNLKSYIERLVDDADF